ncbi:MFS transporter [Paraburkholderia sp. CNPSo 3274]|uniref:MFS transporter n=1 Tax=Paraburkholderia sp. CNPSo 3274 TaxID=2940932 RepID=UPI0020B77E92|nr:MFS transporter [Paraburkholderia sp. CNPSo 3274]MCP3710310.1 MFS transporter [Paraburkholderia sp. CNPSo 3274]
MDDKLVATASTTASADATTAVTTAAANFRWRVLIWLLFGGIINYLDRANLAIAAPGMIHDLGLTRTQIGLLGTVFAWTYAVMQLPAGWIIDRFGAKRAYAVGMIWWSVATWLTGVVGSISGLIVMRVLLAVGEAPCWPTSAKITAAWFPAKERGFATGIWDSSSKWGPALAPAVLVALMIAFGWRSLSHVTGAIGIVFAVLFLFLYRNPAQSTRLTREEFAYIEAGGGGHERSLTTAPIRWRALFASRSVWGMIFGYFCAIWLWNIFLVFLPLYLLDRFHNFGGAFSPVVAGFIVDRTGSYSLAFIMGGAIAACAALFYWFMARSTVGQPADAA